MDLGTLIGVGVVTIAVFVTALLDGVSISHLLLPAPLVLIFVGTFGAAAGGLLLSEYAIALKGLQRAFAGKAPDGSELVDVIVKMADRARREGLLALEDMAKEIEDPLLKEGIQMTVDGTDAAEIEELLMMRIDAKKDQDKIGVAFYEAMGGYAPTIGVVGAVLGLIHALGNLDDVAALGEMIASAFVATMWGVFIANAVWLPVSAKLKRISQLEVKNMEMIVEGVLAVAAGTSPRVVEQKLRSSLPASAGAKGKDTKAA
ncbi:chemotaxis protein MotA [Austwickia chelonae]|uniref:Chemotaxis protein MotA n=1 Tax=Austwickia chelonae NBRC 105200 TaxID=1184607 RepID=K6VQW7_9MICO|nr:motility protein A [Austwickia chelonae]GAB77765.1 chemotaxis protein MotA [Austwickia chelonae NBRC 105200]SEV89048.1 chemotaxis protein MotA [Austwickia chelonae]